MATFFLDEPSYRYGREAGASLLKMLDGVIASSPKNRHLLEMGVRMQAQFAQAFAEEDDEEYARSLYATAKDYGLRALKDPARSGSLEEVRAALQKHDEDEVGLIFWTGMAYGGWINLFIASLRFDRPVFALYRASLPFFGPVLLSLAIITYVPDLSLGLTGAVEGIG